MASWAFVITSARCRRQNGAGQRSAISRFRPSPPNRPYDSSWRILPILCLSWVLLAVCVAVFETARRPGSSGVLACCHWRAGHRDQLDPRPRGPARPPLSGAVPPRCLRLPLRSGGANVAAWPPLGEGVAGGGAQAVPSGCVASMAWAARLRPATRMVR